MPPSYQYTYDLTDAPRQPLAPTNINSILNPAPAYSYPGRPCTAADAAPSNKRKASVHDDGDGDEGVLHKRKTLRHLEDEDDPDEGIYVTQNCDQIRRKIHSFINSGEMKVGEFQQAIGVNSKGYSLFMGQSGPNKGSGSNTYLEAFKFFKRREDQGIKIAAPKKKAKTATAASEGSAALDAIQLEGEADCSVPIFDSCDEVRKKIRAYLAAGHSTQAEFLREIAKPFHDGRKIQSKVLNDFLGKRGAYSGNTSAVFYGAYVFFEKLRLRDGKPKSKHRLDMEKAHPGKGMDTKRRRDFVTCMKGEKPYTDSLGQLHIAGRF
ncbi:hypothetical protein VTL71DRAFT_6247 [Oculimacula yallundae]|uniref:DUF7726 domain-containing protein n=1 Tax=Oculimacula yallundae TaxID=86028 RepID=A0ABR4BZU7_9HELO